MSNSIKLGGAEPEMNCQSSQFGSPTDIRARPPHHPVRSVVAPTQQSPPPPPPPQSHQAPIMRPSHTSAEHPPRIPPKSTKAQGRENGVKPKNKTNSLGNNAENISPTTYKLYLTTQLAALTKKIEEATEKNSNIKKELEEFDLKNASESTLKPSDPNVSSSPQSALVVGQSIAEDDSEMRGPDHLNPEAIIVNGQNNNLFKHTNNVNLPDSGEPTNSASLAEPTKANVSSEPTQVGSKMPLVGISKARFVTSSSDSSGVQCRGDSRILVSSTVPSSSSSSYASNSVPTRDILQGSKERTSPLSTSSPGSKSSTSSSNSPTPSKSKIPTLSGSTKPASTAVSSSPSQTRKIQSKVSSTVQTRDDPSSSGASSAKPRADPSSSGASSVQPRADPSSSGASSAKPRADPSSSGASSAKPRADPSSSGASSAQPRDDPPISARVDSKAPSNDASNVQIRRSERIKAKVDSTVRARGDTSSGVSANPTRTSLTSSSPVASTSTAPPTSKTKTPKTKQTKAAAPTASRKAQVPATTTAAAAATSTKRDLRCFHCKKMIVKQADERPCEKCHYNYSDKCVEKHDLFEGHKKVLAQIPNNDKADGLKGNQVNHTNVCNNCSRVESENRFATTIDGLKRANCHKDDIVSVFGNYVELLLGYCLGEQCLNYPILATMCARTGNNYSHIPHMTWEMIKKKANAKQPKKQYKSIEEVLFDVKKLVHKKLIQGNFGATLVTKCNQLLEFAQREADLISECHSCIACYRDVGKGPTQLYKTMPTELGGSFINSCQNPHTLVWMQMPDAKELRNIWNNTKTVRRSKLTKEQKAKQSKEIEAMAGKFWPGKVLPYNEKYATKLSETQVKVRIFGPQILFVENWDKLKYYSKEMPEPIQMTAELQLAIDEANHHEATHLDRQRFANTIPELSSAFLGLDHLYIDEKEEFKAIAKSDPKVKTFGKNAKWPCWGPGCKCTGVVELHNVVATFCSEECRDKFYAVKVTPFETRPRLAASGFVQVPKDKTSDLTKTTRTNNRQAKRPSRYEDSPIGPINRLINKSKQIYK